MSAIRRTHNNHPVLRSLKHVPYIKVAQIHAHSAGHNASKMIQTQCTPGLFDLCFPSLVKFAKKDNLCTSHRL